MTLPIAIADWSQTTGGGAITILFQGDESPPEKPRAHGRWNTPLEGISYDECRECKGSSSRHESGTDIQSVNGSGGSNPPCI